MASRRTAFTVFPLLALLVVVLDQGIKLLVLRHLALHEPVPLTGFLNLTLVYNRGAAFGFLNQQSGWQLVMFAAIAVFVVAYVAHHIYSEAWRSPATVVAYGLLAGGAIGNLVDRLRLGYVVDYIDFYLGEWHFWVFNLADCALTVGVTALLGLALHEYRAWRRTAGTGNGSMHDD